MEMWDYGTWTPGGPSKTTGFGREEKAQGPPRAPHSAMTCGMLLCEWGENELHSCEPGETGFWSKLGEELRVQICKCRGEAPAGGRFGVLEDK